LVGSRGLGFVAGFSAVAFLSVAVRAAEAAVGAARELLLSRLAASLVVFDAIDVLTAAEGVVFAGPAAGFAVDAADLATNGFLVATDDFNPFCVFDPGAAPRRSSVLLGRAAPPLTAAALDGSAGLIEPDSSALVVGLSGFAGWESLTMFASCSPTTWSFSSTVADMAGATGKKLARTLLRGLLFSASKPMPPGDLPLASREFSAALFSNSDRRLRTADDDRSGDISVLSIWVSDQHER
jgi:hypothetical protein